MESQDVAEATWIETLSNQTHRDFVARISRTMALSFELMHLAAAFFKWTRQNQERLVDKAAVQVQSRWHQMQASTESQLQQLADNAARLELLRMRKVTEEQQRKIIRLTLAVWLQEVQNQRGDRELACWEDTALELPNTQQRFEEVACERYADRCFLLRQRSRCFRAIIRAFDFWRAALHQLRSERHRLKAAARARWTGAQCQAERKRSMLNLAFSGWQSAACRIRRRWLEKRCRLLEGSQLQVHKKGSNAFLTEKLGDDKVTQRPQPDSDFATRLYRYTSDTGAAR